MTAPQTLQAGVQKIDIKPEKTLGDVIDQNGGGDWWSGLTPQDKNDVSEAYKGKYLTPLFDQYQLPDQDRNDILTAYNKKYQVGSIEEAGKTFDQLPVISPDLGTRDQASDYLSAASLYAGGVIDPMADTLAGLIPGMNPKFAQGQQQKALNQYPGIATDPGFLGDAYRFHQNPVANTVGQIAGAFAGTGALLRNAGAGLAKGVGMIPGLTGLSQTARAGMGAAGAFQGLSGFNRVLQGQQHPLSAIADTGLAFGTGGLAGKGRLLNAGIQGVGAGGEAGLSSAFSDMANGQKVDYGKALQSAGQGAAIGAGIGLAVGGTPKAPKRVLPKARLKGDIDTLINQAQDFKEYSSVKRSERQTFKDIASTKSVSKAETLKAQANAYKSQYERLAGLERQPEAPAIVRKAAAQLKAKSQARYERVKAAQGNPVPKPLNKEQMPAIVEAGVKANINKGEDAKKFKQLLKKYTSDDQFKVNKAIERKLNTIKRENETKARIQQTRNRRKADIARKEREAQKQEQARAKQTLKDKRDWDEATRKFKEADIKQAEKQAKAPKILDNAEIEAKAEQLFQHSQKNEKGSLDAKLKYYRKAASEDITKYGFGKERAQATNDSYRKVLDAYAQKKAESAKKPSVTELKAGQEHNRKELARLNEQGGRYNPGDKTALQKPSKGLTVAELKKTAEWGNFDAETKQKATEWGKAAENDSAVIIEYYAERVGDTGQYINKQVYPRELDVIDGALVGRGVNKNGHDATYYLSPSKPNAKTGFVSYTEDITPMPETAGSGRDKGLIGSAYHGQREVPVKGILERPYREVVGVTSETQAMIARLYGQSVREVRKSIRKDLGKVAKAAKGATESVTQKAKVVDDAQLKQVLTSEPKIPKQKAVDEYLDAIYGPRDNTMKAREQMHKDITGDPCD